MFSLSRYLILPKSTIWTVVRDSMSFPQNATTISYQEWVEFGVNFVYQVYAFLVRDLENSFRRNFIFYSKMSKSLMKHITCFLAFPPWPSNLQNYGGWYLYGVRLRYYPLWIGRLEVKVSHTLPLDLKELINVVLRHILQSLDRQNLEVFGYMSFPPCWLSSSFSIGFSGTYSSFSTGWSQG